MSKSVGALTAWRAKRVPALGAFLDEVERHLSSGDPEAFWACSGAFEALVGSGAVRDLVRAELERAVEEPTFLPPSSGDTMTIAGAIERAGFHLLVKCLRPASLRARLQSLPEHVQMGVLGPDPVLVDVYRQAPGYANDVFDRTRRLTPEGQLVVAPGTTARFRSWESVVRFSGSEKGTLAIFFLSSTVQQLRWSYDPDTLLPMRAYACDREASRLDFVAMTLAEMGDPTAVPALLRLCDHPAHFVRWSALGGLLRLDFEKGVKRLERAREDEHPHIRNGARRALDRLESER